MRWASRHIIEILVIVLIACLVTGVALFLLNANRDYHINSGFRSLSLNFDPNTNTSTYTWDNTKVTVKGAFIKGLQRTSAGTDALVIRALSPLPSIDIAPGTASNKSLSLMLENIDPDYYAKMIGPAQASTRITVNTLRFDLDLSGTEIVKIAPGEPSAADSSRYVVMGDNRDGYDTFDTIIAQVDTIKPLFVIDNGDLVFSGKPNQYRLFDHTVSGISTTLCTTLGNHDIRADGRALYTKLYGPAYYSFDFGKSHFVFLDSSPGWTQEQAISEAQYSWLASDLHKAQGKDIFVVTHVPPVDPRTGITTNDLPSYVDKLKTDKGAIETLLDRYEENQKLDHGFPNKQEASRFESLVASAGVDTVYCSHVHSYFDYQQDGVRYVISGGAGAELLTEGSYYHYLIAKTGDPTLTIVQTPTPPNTLVARYGATALLFAKALYEENRAAVIFFLIGVALLVILLLLLMGLRLRRSRLWVLGQATAKSFAQNWRVLFPKKDRST